MPLTEDDKAFIVQALAAHAALTQNGADLLTPEQCLVFIRAAVNAPREPHRGG